MNRSRLLAASTLGRLILAVAAAEPPSPDQQAALASRIQPALVEVEFELQPDRGESPRGGGLMARCPNCGEYHVALADELIETDRPLSMPGCLIAPDRVLIPEVLIHPRFVRAINIRAGDHLVAARIVGRARARNALLLAFDPPLDGAQTLAFNASAPEPHLVVHFQNEGEWRVLTHPVPATIVVSASSGPMITLPAPGLVCSLDGQVVGASLNGELPLDGSWKGPPTAWDWLDATTLAQQEEALRAVADRGLLRVHLRFRSPPQTTEDGMMRRYGLGDPEADAATDRQCVGVLVGDQRLLVLASLTPRVTARLEQILVHPPVGEPIQAHFVATLKDHGLLVADLAQALPGKLEASSQPIIPWLREPLWLADVSIKGELRVAWFEPASVENIKRGPRQLLYPELRRGSPGGFLFDGQQRLLAVPVGRRAKPSTGQHYYWDNENSGLTPLCYLTDALADFESSADLANIPLDEQEANRLAWAGIELQAMTPDLARANGVSHLTREGETGALVTLVHPDSPAAEAGVQLGWILLRIRPSGETTPIDIAMEQGFEFDNIFPWERLDEIPTEYFDRLPPPWPGVENAFTELLAELGRGTAYTAEFFANGKVVEREMVVVPGPLHYNSAPKYKSESLGISVRGLTFEVRRYLNLDADAPGVVVAKVEPGGKAAVAGVKPYELVTHINDTPVPDVDAFQRMTSAGGDLRLNVKRMTRGRVVTLRTEAPR